MALKKLIGGIVVLGAVGAGAFLFVTAPERLPAETWAATAAPDLANGARHNPALYRELVAMEQESGFTFRADMALGGLIE